MSMKTVSIVIAIALWFCMGVCIGCKQQATTPQTAQPVSGIDTIHTALALCNQLPTEAQGRAMLKKRIVEESQGAISLVSFTKTNGLKKEIYGVVYYTMEYSVVIRFERECWKAGNGFVGWFSDFRVLNAEPTGWDAWMAGDTKHFVAGDQVSLDGKLDFEKAEKGWRQTR